MVKYVSMYRTLFYNTFTLRGSTTSTPCWWGVNVFKFRVITQRAEYMQGYAVEAQWGASSGSKYATELASEQFFQIDL